MSKKQMVGVLDRALTLEIVRVTEQAAIAAARLRGRGDEKAADQAAVDAMRRELNRIDIQGRVVIGEGERDEAPMLYIGEEVGTGNGPEGRHRRRSAGRHDHLRQEPAELARRARHGRAGGRSCTRPTSTWTRSPSARAIADGVVDLDATPDENIASLAKAKGVQDHRDHRLHPRPAAPREAHRGRAQDRRRHPAHRRRRHRRRHPHDRSRGDRHRHLFRRRRRAGRRAGGGGAALHRRPDAERGSIPMKDADYQRAEADRHQGHQAQVHDDGAGVAATCSSPRPASPTAICWTASSSGRGSIETETVVMRSATKTVRWIRTRHGCRASRR